ITGRTNRTTVQAGTAIARVFFQQPTNTMGGAAISPAVTLGIVDLLNNAVTTSTNEVSVDATSTNAFTAGSTTLVNAVNGVATFSNLVGNTPGTYHLLVDSGGLIGLDSADFDVTAPTAD